MVFLAVPMQLLGCYEQLLGCSGNLLGKHSYWGVLGSW